MNINYTWRNATKSEAIEDILQKKFEKHVNHFDKVSRIHVVLENHNKQENTVKVTLHLPGIEINAHATDEDMYKAIDHMLQKLLRQIDAHKAKSNEHKGKIQEHLTEDFE